jgi:hypothetical protein
MPTEPVLTLDGPLSYLEVGGWTIELQDRDGRLVWEVWRYMVPAKDLDKRGHRKPYAVAERAVRYTSPWLRQAINWAVAERNSSTDAEQAELFALLEAH